MLTGANNIKRQPDIICLPTKEYFTACSLNEGVKLESDPVWDPADNFREFRGLSMK